MKIKISYFKGLFSAFAVLLGLAVLLFIIINQSGDFSEPENQTKATIEITKNQTIYHKSHTILTEKSHEKETSQLAEKRKNLGTLEKENSDPLLKSEGYLKTEDTIAGVGLSEKELKALHASQRQEIEQMHMDMDAIVIAPAEEGDEGITLGELLALHEQQKREIANTDDLDEIVIPAFKEDSPGLTRMDLIQLHKQQKLAIDNAQAWDQIVISASEDGSPDLTWDEVAAVQEQQDDEILETTADPYELAAPFPEDGGPDMTVQELKNLHRKQSVN